MKQQAVSGLNDSQMFCGIAHALKIVTVNEFFDRITGLRTDDKETY